MLQIKIRARSEQPGRSMTVQGPTRPPFLLETHFLMHSVLQKVAAGCSPLQTALDPFSVCMWQCVCVRYDACLMQHAHRQVSCLIINKRFVARFYTVAFAYTGVLDWLHVVNSNSPSSGPGCLLLGLMGGTVPSDSLTKIPRTGVHWNESLPHCYGTRHSCLHRSMLLTLCVY